MKQFLCRVFTDNVKANLLRWWIVGMCYFMIAFGTGIGRMASPVDLIFALGVGIGLVTVVIYNPIAYNVFNIERNGAIINQKYLTRSGVVKAGYNLLEIGLSLVTVILVYLTYQNVNLLINSICNLPEDVIVIPGEPFGFATLYLVFYGAIIRLGHMVKMFTKKKGQ